MQNQFFRQSFAFVSSFLVFLLQGGYVSLSKQQQQQQNHYKSTFF